MTGVVPGLSLAVVGTDGAVAFASGEWPTGSLDQLPLGNGYHALDIVARSDRIAVLVSMGDAPESLLEGVQRSVALLARDSMEKHDLARETLERYRELNLLYRASATIGASLDASVVPELLLVEAQRAIPSDAAAFILGDGAPTEGLEHAAELVHEVRTTGRPDIATWTPTDEQTLASALCVPVRAGERVLGSVLLARTAGRPAFNAGDEKLLLGVASQAGLALERAWLHEHETRQLQLEEELAVARRIQLAMLPSSPPTLPGWSFAATYRAARQVGGDFYDFLDHAVSDRRLGLVIADVTGKGVPAALMMAYSRAVLRAESMAGGSPAEVLSKTNQLITKDRQTQLFLSAFYADLDLDSGRLTFASAGHDAPLWISADGSATRDLEAPGVILGAFNNTGLESRAMTIAPGETIIFYTDGVTEARNLERRAVRRRAIPDRWPRLPWRVASRLKRSSMRWSWLSPTSQMAQNRRMT